MFASQSLRLRLFWVRGRKAVGGLVILWLVGYFVLPWCVPWPAALGPPVPGGIQLVDRHGVPLRRLLEEGRRAVESVPLAEVPTALREATLAAEDHRFFSHGGIDFLAVGRALRDAMFAGQRVSGASTITQQLVKLAVPRPRTWRTKVIEILTARRVEMTWSKAQIFEQYLARLEYGNLHRGPAAAAAGYFGKPLRDCSLAECAFLAGLPQAPSRLNPWRHAHLATQRQQWILSRLAALQWVDAATLGRAAAEPLQLRRAFGAFAAPHFVDLLLDRSAPEIGAAGTWATSLDMNLQGVCERSVTDRLNRLGGRNVTQAAVVVIHNETGEVRALVGSRDYDSKKAGQVNGATARRSPGSALKPFTYLLALSKDLSPASIIPDLPVEYMTPTGLYRPQNYHHRAMGPTSLRQALASSLNLSAVRVLEHHGGAGALVASLQMAGITTLTQPPDDYGLGLTIGGGEVTLLELTAAYSHLARLGVMRPVRFTPALGAGTEQRIYDPDACWLLADVLSDNGARAGTFGTSSALRLPFPCAVKTGTSTDYRDNWAVGYHPVFTVGVWVGNFDGSPMRGVSGVTGAAPIFRDVFTWLDARFPATWYPRPASVVACAVDPLTGLLRPEHLEKMRPVVMEKFRRELAPNGSDSSRYDGLGRVILPPEYGAWLAGPENSLGSSVVGGEMVTRGATWRILSPLAGTTLLLDPDLPQGGRALALRVSSSVAGVVWTSPTLKIVGQTAWLEPGRHELTAHDQTTGQAAVTWVEVRRL